MPGFKEELNIKPDDISSNQTPKLLPTTMQAETPPILPSIPEIHQERVSRIKSHFVSKFNCEPTFYVRVPGRVNLIGEHIDYCGYGVFPMALTQDILAGVSVNGDREIRLSNTNHGYQDKNVNVDDMSINRPPKWYDYFYCGVEGIRSSGSTITGMNVVVDGAVPPSAGLSSSSALVCSAALASAIANNVQLSKQDLANICAKSERHVGTEGGGMDQAIAFLANEGTAKMIEFMPLRAKDVKLPAGAIFVVANSLAESNKAAGNDYNCRVMECRLATQILAKSQALYDRAFRCLGDFQEASKLGFPAVIKLVKDELHEEPYTKEEICNILGINEATLNSTILSTNTENIREFKLRQRALHVFEEANRVRIFKTVCEVESGVAALEKLGTLMIASHVSLRDQYECSHPQLDKLVALSENIAYGARLTGAGWGGCIVALVPGDKVATYLQKLHEEYYKNLPAFQGLEFGNVAFQTQPGSGAYSFNS